MYRRSLLCLSLVPLLLSSGCWWFAKKSETSELRADVGELDTRLEKKEQDIESKVKRLQEVLDEATSLLKRNSADVGADVQAMQEELRQLRGLVTEAQRYANEIRVDTATMKTQLTGLDERVAKLEFVIEELTRKPPDPNVLWDEGKTAMERGDVATAEARFKSLVLQFPEHDRADDAQYNRGEMHYQKQEYDQAIAAFQRVWDKHPDSSLADDAMYRAGEAAQTLKHCNEARAYFGLLTSRYSKSNLVRKAKAKLSQISKDLKNSKKCLK